MLDFNRISLLLTTPSPVPLYGRLRDALSIQITDGTLRSGEMLPSERVIQEKLRVSRATVRQALRGLIEAGLVQSVHGSGNFVLEQQNQGFAPRLPVVDEKTVGMLVSFPSFHIYYGQLMAVFNQHMRQAGWHTELALHNDRIDTLQEIISRMLLNNVRVFAINPLPRQEMEPILEDLISHGVLLLQLGRRLNYHRCDYVGADNELVGYQAAQHLIQLGHSRIVYQGLIGHSTGEERAAGYVRAMREAGLEPRIFTVHYMPDPTPSPEFLPYLDSKNTEQHFFDEILHRHITAAFCFNDEGAAWTYDQVRKMNMHVPRDFSLVGVDNLRFYGYVDAPLTTFALPGEEVGRQAAELLLRRIAGEKFPPQQVALPPIFVPRGSTATPHGISHSF